MTVQTTEFKVGDKTVSFETGLLAKSASAAVVVRCGETMILVTATGAAEPRPGIDFFPLLVDFEERMYAVGRLPGGFLKKEGRPSEKSVLTSRLIDRPLRPLWPDGYRKDVQVVANALSMDGENQPDVLSIVGASMALTLSGLPFDGPVGAARVGRLNGQWILNPTYKQTADGDLDIVVAGTADSILMVEAGADFVSEDDLIVALEMAHVAIKEQVAVQLAFAKTCNVERKPFEAPYDLTPVVNLVKATAGQTISDAFHQFDREVRQQKVSEAKQAVKDAYAALPDTDPVKVLVSSHVVDLIGEAFKKVEKTIMRSMVLEKGIRADGRKLTEIRPITTQVGYVPRVHGSGLFTRGSTQVLSICTLGAPGDAQMLDGVDPATEKRWIHHYAFPGYSVGEVRPLRGAGRREIGHGALAERAIAPALPSKADFPYTLRVNSEVLESNGSSSMASTCGTSMALMDAGVPLKSPIGGIAMGLVKEGDQFAVLSDIQGLEDFLGDMDFKVTGNQTGVTALQMDIKIRGISIDIMRQALAQAKEGRLHILQKMDEAIKAPRNELSTYAPRIISLKIDTDQIGTVIGPGGKMIRSIIETTGATIDIDDSGLVTITSVSGLGGEEAKAIIERLTKKIEIGMLSMGKVVRIIPAGAFVELIPGKDGMVHISQLVPRRVEKVEDIVKVGDEVLVKVIDIDDRGRVNLTMKGVNDDERASFGLPPQAEMMPVS
jgi:polyribonucleotide nucleotidyltransferase